MRLAISAGPCMFLSWGRRALSREGEDLSGLFSIAV
jgi:hypothetical protein